MSEDVSVAKVGARILIVDDDPLSSTFQSHLASLLGHDATVLTDGAQALELALSGDYDLLLLDLGMPQPDGFEVLRQLREHELQLQQPPLPVVAVTGYASETDRMRCLGAGFTEHLAKPIQASSLSNMIERALRLGDAAATSTTTPASDAERLRATVKRLSEVRPDDRSFAPTVTESFALRSAQLLETLRNATAQRNSEQLARAARALKSSAEFLGAHRLASMAQGLDRAGCEQRWDDVSVMLCAMENEHQAVLTLLFESTSAR